VKGLSVAALALLIATPALAGGLDDGKRESTRDLPLPKIESPSHANHSGFYVNGALGYHWTDRDVSGGIFGQKMYDDESGEEGEVLPQLPGTFHKLDFGGTDQLEDFVYVVGASYLFHMPGKRLGFEVGIDGTLYNDNESAISFSGFPQDFTPDGIAENVSGDEHVGAAKFERNFDLDLLFKGHYFLTSNWSAYAGGGLSWARASAQGGHANLDGEYANAYDDDDDSFGYALVAGTQVWVTDRFYIGAEYGYKKHDFDFGSSSSKTEANLPGSFEGPGSGPGSRVSSDRLSVEDETHTIKAKVGFKLGGVE
jgi:opacity protein-like surface antigen